MQADNALLNEVKHHLDRLAELAVAIRNEGLTGEAAALFSAETPADYANGVALLGQTVSASSDPLNQAEYETLVAELGYTPTLDVQAFINYDLRENFANALLALSL